MPPRTPAASTDSPAPVAEASSDAMQDDGDGAGEMPPDPRQSDDSSRAKVAPEGGEAPPDERDAIETVTVSGVVIDRNSFVASHACCASVPRPWQERLQKPVLGAAGSPHP